MSLIYFSNFINMYMYGLKKKVQIENTNYYYKNNKIYLVFIFFFVIVLLTLLYLQCKKYIFYFTYN